MGGLILVVIDLWWHVILLFLHCKVKDFRFVKNIMRLVRRLDGTLVLKSAMRSEAVRVPKADA